MTSFLKAQQLPKSKPLPDDETLPAKLAEHVVSLATSVKQLGARKAQRDAKAQALEGLATPNPNPNPNPNANLTLI